MPKRSREDSLSSVSSSLLSIDEPFHSSKYAQTAVEEPASILMECSLPPHGPISFASYAAYEVHCVQNHTNRCSACHKNFPTEHFLNLHIGENHDPLAEALKAKGEKTYHCFVDDCAKICSSPYKRRMHLTAKHLFPANYDFHVIDTGIDRRSSMLRTRPSHRRRSSATTRATYTNNKQQQCRSPANKPIFGATEGETDAPMNTEETPTSIPLHNNDSAKIQVLSPSNEGRPQVEKVSSVDEVDALTTRLSSLNFVPPSVRFGRGGRRSGFAKS